MRNASGWLIASLFVICGTGLAIAAVSEKDLKTKKERWARIPLDVSFPDSKQFEKKADEGKGKAAGKAVDWASLITPAAIEKELTEISVGLPDDVKNAGYFKSRGAGNAEVRTGVAAVLFNIIAHLDAKMKWKEHALILRDLAAAGNAGAIEKDDAGFEACKAASDALANLLKSNKATGDAGELGADWSDVASFNTLMKRMEESQRLKLYKWTANQGEFEKNADGITHEARILAVMCQLIIDNSYGYNDGGDFQDLAVKLRDDCLTTIKAVESKDFDTARSAVANINLHCDNCHTAYR